MSHHPTSQELRSELMAPEAIKRVKALYALELEVEKAHEPKLAKDLEAFAARGIPFYSPEDPSYRDWVAKAVKFWELVHHEEHHVPAMTAAHGRSARVKAIATSRASAAKRASK